MRRLWQYSLSLNIPGSTSFSPLLCIILCLFHLFLAETIEDLVHSTRIILQPTSWTNFVCGLFSNNRMNLVSVGLPKYITGIDDFFCIVLGGGCIVHLAIGNIIVVPIMNFLDKVSWGLWHKMEWRLTLFSSEIGSSPFFSIWVAILFATVSTTPLRTTLFSASDHKEVWSFKMGRYGLDQDLGIVKFDWAEKWKAAVKKR